MKKKSVRVERFCDLVFFCLGDIFYTVELLQKLDSGTPLTHLRYIVRRRFSQIRSFFCASYQVSVLLAGRVDKDNLLYTENLSAGVANFMDNF